MNRSIIIDKINLESSKNALRLSARISFTDEFIEEPFELWFSFPKKLRAYISVSANPFLAALLPLAMVKNYNLRIIGSISERLYAQTPQIMDIFSSWYDHMHPVQINADTIQANDFKSTKVGSFFTGGVDSFYTVLKNLNFYENEAKIEYLVYVHGFDISLENKTLYKTVKKEIEQIADALKLKSLMISTNLRTLTNRCVRWGQEQHGAALAGVALGISNYFKILLLPSSCAYSELYPWGSHPNLDNLWSAENLQIIHDGNEAKRSQKILWELSKSDIALDHLRVCWKNFDNSYNCGSCGKCIRTKINLKIAGVLEQCKTLDNELHLDKYQDILIDSFTERRNLRENLNLQEDMDPEFRERLQVLLDSVDNRRNSLSFKLNNFLKQDLSSIKRRVYDKFLFKKYYRIDH